MKQLIRKFLIKQGWYEYIRYSLFFTIYTRLFKRQVIKEHNREVSFYKSFLSPCSLIFDIGAYDGHKTAAFLELADKVVSCEPDLHNYRVLKIRFRNHQSKVFIVNKALADKAGSTTYYIHHAGSAFNTLNPTWKDILEKDNAERWDEKIQFSSETTMQLTTLDCLVKQYGKPGFIKIDVEGYEQFVLKGLSEKVPYLSFECLLPDCKTELITCLDHLQQLDNNVTFNVAYEEALQFPGFVNRAELMKWASQTNYHCFEVVAKMTV